MPKKKQEQKDLAKVRLEELRPVYEILNTQGGKILVKNLKTGLKNDVKWLLDVVDVTDDKFQRELYLRFSQMKAVLAQLKSLQDIVDEVNLVTEILTEDVNVDVV